MQFKISKVEYLPEGESFTWKNRNWPVFAQCDGKGSLFCVKHKHMSEPGKSEEHTEGIKGIHLMVWFCTKHERMEEA